MSEPPPPEPFLPASSGSAPPRTKVVRDVLLFQVKLWLEGFRDIALVPLSLGAALVDLVFRKRSGQGALYAMMRLGDRFERWVHLYAALDPDAPSFSPGKFWRRVFVVCEHDRSETDDAEPGPYDEGTAPVEGIDPLSVEPGVSGKQTERAWNGS